MSVQPIPPVLLLGGVGFMLLVAAAGTLLAIDSRNRAVEQRAKAVARP